VAAFAHFLIIEFPNYRLLFFYSVWPAWALADIVPAVKIISGIEIREV